MIDVRAMPSTDTCLPIGWTIQIYLSEPRDTNTPIGWIIQGEMTMKHAKMLAVVAVAVFCASAFAIAIDTEDSSAVEDQLTYSFYLELKDGSNSYSNRLKDVNVDGSAPTSDLFASALTAAAATAEITVNLSGSWLTSITAQGHTYASSGSWGSAGYVGFAMYYLDGKEWKETDYTDKTMIAIVLDEYLITEPSDASKYLKHEYPGSDPYWTKLPSVSIVDYKVYIQLRDSDGSSFSKWIYSTQMGISGESLASARALGAKDAGFVINNSPKYATSISSIVADGHTYASSGTYGNADYYGYAAYYGTENNEWKDLQAPNLTEVTTVAHVFDNYKTEDPKDSSYYYHEPAYGMDAYWTKLPAESPNSGSGDSGSGGDNTLIYVSVGAVAVIAVGVLAFAFFKKP